MKKYRVRLKNGRVVGPFLARQFKELKSKGHIDGSEDCQEYPLGDWGKITEFQDIQNELNEETQNIDATFIRKISDFKKELETPDSDKTEVVRQDPPIKKDENPDFVEFKFEKEEPVIEIETTSTAENNNVEKTRVVTRAQLNNTSDDDKTLIKPETIEFLKQQKLLEEKKKREEERKKRELEEEEKNKVDLDNDSTQFVDLSSLKGELFTETKQSERELEEEVFVQEKKKEKEALLKEKDVEVIEEKPEKQKKKKKLILILGAVLLLAVLFPEEKKEVKKEVVISSPTIKFPQQYETIDETKASETYAKGMEYFQTFKYDDMLKAAPLFLESTERKFENNPALAKLISVYSKLLPYSKNKIEDANRVFKLVQIVTTKSLKDPYLTTSISNFYLSAEKPAAAVKIVEQFNAIKGNKPTAELFGMYLKSLIEAGNYTKARSVFEKIETVPNKTWEIYKPLIDFSMLNNNFEKAAEFILEAEKTYPNMVELLIYKARLLVYQEDFKSLSSALEKMISLNCENNAAFYSKYYEYGAILAVASKKSDVAVSLFKKALELHESPELRSKLASLSQSTDAAANELILESRALDFISKARKDMEEFKWREAFKNALSATSIAPNYLTAKIFLAKLQTKRSFFKEAIDNLDDLYKNYPQSGEVVYALLDTYIEAYKFNDAKRLIGIISTSDELRSNPTFDATMAKFYLFQDNFNSSVIWLQKAVNSDPLNDDILYEMAKLLLRYRQYDKAKIRLNKCMELDPSKIEYRVSYAEILYETEGTSSAIGYLYDVLKDFPDHPKLLSAIGIYYFKSGQLKNFENIKEKLSTLPDQDKSLYQFLIQSARLEENFDKVIEYSKKLLIIDPSDLEAEMFLGQVYMEKGNYKEALDIFNGVKDRLDTYPKLKYFMSKLYLLTDNTKKAIDLAKEEVKANPGVDEGYVLLGDIYRQEEDYVEAEKWYKEAQKINAKNPETMVGLAFVSYKKSQFDIAIDLFKKAIKINPADRMAYKLLGDVYRQIGQSSEAIETYKVFLELSPESKYKDQIESYIRTMQ